MIRWEIVMEIKKKLNLQTLIYAASIIAVPNIFLFNIYNQNRESAQILFAHILILALIFAFCNVIFFFITKLLTKTSEASLIINIIAWLSFWFFEAIMRIIPSNSRVLISISILLGLALLGLLLRFLAKKLQKFNLIFTATAGVIAILFVLNVFPTLFTAINSSSRRTTGEFTIRREFTIDDSLPSPDIYWFHMDGMISFNSMKKHFNNPQDELKRYLLDLDFVINEDAKLIAHNTVFGVPALLSPDFYDSYLHGLFMQGQNLLRRGRHALLNEALERDGISLANDVSPYHELFHAFLQAGYAATIMIADYYPNVYEPIDQFYRLCNRSGRNNNRDDLFTQVEGGSSRHFLINAGDLIELLALMTPVPARFIDHVSEGHLNWQDIPTHEEEVNRLTENSLNLFHERQIYRALIDSLQTPTTYPTLTYITLMFTHANRWTWQTGEASDSSRVDLYQEAHDYAIRVMKNMFDLILERNPDAVIIIQADHGMHLHTTQRQLLNEGLTEEEVIGLHDSVMSAVRIPEVYGGLDAPLDPLNITRELVNRFVGRNYDLLTN